MSPELEAALAAARKRWADMPRAERIILEREHKIDWVHGEMLLRGHKVTREWVAATCAEQERKAREGATP